MATIKKGKANDLNHHNFYPILIYVKSPNDLPTIPYPARLSFFIFRLDSLNTLSTVRETIRKLNKISDITTTIISIPPEISRRMTTYEIIKKLKTIRDDSSVFLIEEIAIRGDHFSPNPRYEAEDIVIECIDSILYSTVITPSGNYLYELTRFFERKVIGSLNYFTLSLVEDLDNAEAIFRQFMKIPLRNIEPRDINNALIFCNYDAEQYDFNTFIKVLTIVRYISDKLKLNLAPLGNLYDKSMKEILEITYFVSLKSFSVALRPYTPTAYLFLDNF